ncbi:MarR family transcriptional regulator [Sphingomonas gei]|uniref:MarR family transcriptional regulator n=1 Tax=Sphingomonas gei TaxID=1395960 RepID=A0A4S1XGT4_9SPHN|nr:MarR family transcriptional regulator [Sphingomonas gei]TGX55167.1 MarR family transcriptional regulator [Sphingomonas gei]
MTRQDPASALLALDNQLCFAVYSAAHALNRAYKPLLAQLGLTYPQYLALLILWERDGQRVGEIGARLMLDTNTLTPLLKRLEAMGLVARRRSAEDERQVLISLTEKGSAMRARAAAVPPEIFAATGCSLDDIVRLRTELAALRERLDAGSDAR